MNAEKYKRSLSKLLAQRRELRRLNRQIHEMVGRLRSSQIRREQQALVVHRHEAMLSWLAANFHQTEKWIKEYRKTGLVGFARTNGGEPTLQGHPGSLRNTDGTPASQANT